MEVTGNLNLSRASAPNSEISASMSRLGGFVETITGHVGGHMIEKHSRAKAAEAEAKADAMYQQRMKNAVALGNYRQARTNYTNARTAGVHQKNATDAQKQQIAVQQAQNNAQAKQAMNNSNVKRTKKVNRAKASAAQARANTTAQKAQHSVVQSQAQTLGVIATAAGKVFRAVNAANRAKKPAAKPPANKPEPANQPAPAANPPADQPRKVAQQQTPQHSVGGSTFLDPLEGLEPLSDTKTCDTCGDSKEIEHFQVKRGNRYGTKIKELSTCKDCR